jgi:hypothetical protein
MARNVRIEVDPPFDSSVYRSGPVPLARFKLFAEGIPALAAASRAASMPYTAVALVVWPEGEA